MNRPIGSTIEHVVWLAAACSTITGCGIGIDPSGSDQQFPAVGTPIPAEGEPVCPSAQQTLNEAVRSVYAIMVVYATGPNTGDEVTVFIGTAFAVSHFRLATAAHVGLAILHNELPVKMVLGVQAGTGSVIEITGVAVHPAYVDEELLSTPDVAILETFDGLTDRLPLRSPDETVALALADPIYLAGFPGDVDDVFVIVPGTNVPQATALTGTITSLRSFDDNVAVDPDNTDIIQYQIPTSPGTSGSPLLHCGHVIGVHTAGTDVASNKFGIHVKFLNDLLNAVLNRTVPLTPLPPPPPDYSGTFNCDALDLAGAFSHTFYIDSERHGAVHGESCWNDANPPLRGSVDDYGRVTFADETVSITDFAYEGFINPASETASGEYYRDGLLSGTWLGSLYVHRPGIPNPYEICDATGRIDGSWNVTATIDGEAISFCLTIADGRVTEFFDGCSAANELLSSTEVVFNGESFELKFSTLVGSLGFAEIELFGTKRGALSYDVRISIAFVANHIGAMGVMTRL
ncbi:MAG: trypsin-like peptidase domain-containing protein [Phycisphaerales bacterium]|nr:trypsin-like peptidase domain-containing protein [Phycisphaerales bacterium]